MLYFEQKVQLMIRYEHIKNRIKRLSNFTGEKYIKYEEIIMIELKELLRIIEHDMLETFDDTKDYINIMNINLKKDCNDFSILIQGNDCVENDFFLSFLVYINLSEIIKYKEYYCIDLIDISLNNLDSLLNSFKICAKEGSLVFKFEKVVGSYYSLDNTAMQDKLEPYVCYEHIEDNEGCFNTYYISNMNDYVFSKFKNLFNIKY